MTVFKWHSDEAQGGKNMVQFDFTTEYIFLQRNISKPWPPCIPFRRIWSRAYIKPFKVNFRLLFSLKMNSICKIMSNSLTTTHSTAVVTSASVSVLTGVMLAPSHY